MTTLHHRKLLTLLLGAEFCVSFAFFGIHSLLILFLIKHKGFADIAAYGVWKNFATLTFVAALIGGFVGGRYLSFRLATLLGLGLMTLGYISLNIPYHTDLRVIYFGLALIASGTGLFATNARNLLGANAHNRLHRYNGFTYYHLADMLGQVAGPTVLTYLSLYTPIGLFGAAAIAVSLGFLFFLVNYPHIAKHIVAANPDRDQTTAFHNTNRSLGLFIVALLVSIVTVTMYLQASGFLLAIWIVGVIIALIFILRCSNHTDRIRITTLLLLISAFITVLICFRQALSVFGVFIDRFLDRTVWGYTIPSGVMFSIEPLLVMVLAPFALFAWKSLDRQNIKITEGTLLSIGLIFLSLSYGALVVGGMLVAPGKLVGLSWFIVSNVLMACGELLTLPIALAAVTAYAPKRWRGFMMGCFILCTGFASYLSGFIGQFISPPTGAEKNLAVYSHVFAFVSGLALISGFILFFCVAVLVE